MTKSLIGLYVLVLLAIVVSGTTPSSLPKASTGDVKLYQEFTYTGTVGHICCSCGRDQTHRIINTTGRPAILYFVKAQHTDYGNGHSGIYWESTKDYPVGEVLPFQLAIPAEYETPTDFKIPGSFGRDYMAQLIFPGQTVAGKPLINHDVGDTLNGNLNPGECVVTIIGFK